MPAVFTCPECQHRFHLPGGFSEYYVRCPACYVSSPVDWEATLPEAEPVDALAWDNENHPRQARQHKWHPSERDATNHGLLGVLTVVVLVVGGIGFTAYWVEQRERGPSSKRALKDNEQQPRADVRKALVELPPLAEGEIAEELKPHFARLSAAHRAHDGERAIAEFDIDRMAEEFMTLAQAPVKTEPERRQLVAELKTGMQEVLVKPALCFDWNSTEIRSVKKLSEVESVVIARHEHSAFGTVKMRWWVTRREGTWKIFDYEELGCGLRCSAVQASLMQRGPVSAPDLQEAMLTMNEAAQDLLGHDLDAAERKLRLIATVRMPREFDSLRCMMMGAIRIERGQWREALTDLDRAAKFRPDMPVLELLKGLAFNGLEEPEKALKHLETYRDLLGDDAIVCAAMGQALRALGRFDEAARMERKALDLQPKDKHTQKRTFPND